jgi:transposase InsO family protein
VSFIDDQDAARRARAQDVALFRYRLIAPALEPGVTTRQRGRLVRGIAAQVHAGPGGPVRVSRKSLDRWIRAWRAGGFEALCPSPRQVAPRTEAAVLELATALKKENPQRTAAQVARIIAAHRGWAPSERTLQRHFVREEIATGPRGVVHGRFEAGAPNLLWTGDVLHGPPVTGRKSYLFAFIDDHSRLVTGYRWGFSEDSLHLAEALKRAIAIRGVPARIYVDNGACFSDETLPRYCAKLGINLVHSPPYRPPLTGQSLDHSPVVPPHVNREPDQRRASCRPACRVDGTGSGPATGVSCLMLDRSGLPGAGNAGGSRAGGGPPTGSCATTTWVTWPTGGIRRPASVLTRSTCCTLPAGSPASASAWRP